MTAETAAKSTADTTAAAAEPARFDLARFGAALLRGAEEESADDQAATYKVQARFSVIADFYQAIYGQQKGMVVETIADSETIMVAVGKTVQEADFSTLMVTPHPEKMPNLYRVMVMARGEVEEDENNYPDSSPWAKPTA